MRSAERGPTPGICRSCAIKSLMGAGYSVFLKIRLNLFHWPLCQLENQWFQPTHIELQRRIVFGFRTTRLLEFSIGFGPAFLSIKDHATPKGVAAGDAFGPCFS